MGKAKFVFCSWGIAASCGAVHVQVNTQFLRLPLQLDTPSKRVHKEGLERRLAQIESDIRLLQRGDRLIVVQD